MANDNFDLIVIGAGSAARDAAAKASREHGARVALIERTRWGGSCPNVACRPTKAYLVAAELAYTVNELSDWMGVECGPARVDLARVRAWKDSLRRAQESWVEVLTDAGYEVVPGEAAFADARTVRVGDRDLSADRILIATGSRTAVPPAAGIEHVDWIDHVSALELEEIPESLLVVGAGPVGLEFAQIFRRFGSRVTIVNHGSQIAARADTEAADELQAALEGEGIEVVLNADVGSFARDGDATLATLDGGRQVRVSHVLLASGRAPNTEELMPERAGVATERGYVVVDDRQRTNVDGIWAAGDVATGPQFTPAAQYQARIAVEDMFDGGVRHADYSVMPTAIFTDPELGSVGLTEREAGDAGHDVDAVKHPLPNVTRAQFTRTRHGLFKIVFDTGTRRVLGVHVVSRGASDIVGGLAAALQLGVTVDDLAYVHHVYPSYSEGLKAAAERALT
jgi:pyruvate/2-oxoglutarate dehydrogenase complex dihydrolipoamide dehydrogenase (E3) component